MDRKHSAGHRRGSSMRRHLLNDLASQEVTCGLRIGRVGEPWCWVVVGVVLLGVRDGDLDLESDDIRARPEAASRLTGT
ncbi:hypothetical protein ABVB69_37730 [Streptomyces sp. NPDC000349]|uniref:hypothetical protein n=1 Tax=Streptomyces sp. NPDC000349 TaxID=3154249 RepID=UPI003369DE53